MIEHKRVKGIKEIKHSIGQTTAKKFDRKKYLFMMERDPKFSDGFKHSLRSCGFVTKFNTALVNLCQWELLEGAFGRILFCNENSKVKILVIKSYFDIVCTCA